jgi:Ca-activated chloride channel family protein
LLSILPLAFVWWTIWRRQDSHARLRKVIAPHLLEHLVVGETRARRLRPASLLIMIWIITAIAMAGPAWQREAAPFSDDDAGLVVLLKVSSTMKATDIQPSRLQRAKHKLRDLLLQRKGTSTGLVVYSGSAHLVMPLTRDDRIVSAIVEDLTPELMPADGDALVGALNLAEEILERAGVPGSLLVIADNVAASQVERLSTDLPNVPVQFLALSAASVPIDAGLRDAASVLGAPVTRISVDEEDVKRIAQRAENSFKTVAGISSGERWRDAGYTLLPLIALLCLMWSRKGWLVR